MANFINLTPHAINVVGGPTIQPSGSVARVAATSTPAGEFGGVALSRTPPSGKSMGSPPRWTGRSSSSPRWSAAQFLTEPTSPPPVIWFAGTTGSPSVAEA